jgi:hypothetical protein
MPDMMPSDVVLSAIASQGQQFGPDLQKIEVAFWPNARDHFALMSGTR